MVECRTKMHDVLKCRFYGDSKMYYLLQDSQRNKATILFVFDSSEVCMQQQVLLFCNGFVILMKRLIFFHLPTLIAVTSWWVKQGDKGYSATASSKLFIIKRPHSQTDSACRCGRRSEDKENIFFYFLLLHVCVTALQHTTYFSWSQTCLWGHRGNCVHLFIRLCCFIVLVFELEHLFFHSGA